MTIKQILPISLLLATTPLIAQSQPLNDGSYIGTKAGIAQIQTPDKNIPGATNASYKRRDFSWGFNMGYNYFTSHNAFALVELGYDNYGESRYRGTISSQPQTVKVEQYDLDMLFGLGVMADSGLAADIKAGVSRVTQNTKGIVNTTAFLGTDENKTRYRPKVEVDLGYAFNNNLEGLITYTHLFARSAPGFPVYINKAITNNAIYIGLQYTVPQ